MDEENKEELETPENNPGGDANPEAAGEETPKNEEDEEEVLTPEQVADLKKRAKASSQNFERAKKAEAELKLLREQPKDEKLSGSLSTDDVLYLAKADVHEADTQMVVEYSKKMGVSIKEAHGFLRPVLKERAEERATALASQTRTTRTASKVGDSELLSNYNQGKWVPKTDQDFERLAAAEMEAKVKKN